MTPSPLPPPAQLRVDQAQQAILARIQPLADREAVGIGEAQGRVLATAVIAPLDVPAHDNAAMDGYALRAEDLCPGDDTPLRVVGRALAGKPHAGEVGQGEAIRIMTGAVMPTGADTVVMQEVVRVEGDTVTIPAGQRAGQNRRRAGEDLARGGVALAAGKRLGAAELGLLASLGIGEVTVWRRLRVAVLSTGDELARPGQPLAPGQIHDSNRHTLLAALRQLGCETVDLGIVADDPAAMEQAFRAAARSADVVLTSGGVSMGDADHVRDLMAQLGEVAFWRLAMKPGRPMAFGRIGEAWLFGLPGNPVAAMVTFHVLVRDALLALMGVSPLPVRPLLPVAAGEAIRKQPGRREYLRARLCRGEDDQWRAQLTGAQGSGILRSLSEADCLIVLSETQGDVAAGDSVPVMLFEGWI